MYLRLPCIVSTSEAHTHTNMTNTVNLLTPIYYIPIYCKNNKCTVKGTACEALHWLDLWNEVSRYHNTNLQIRLSKRIKYLLHGWPLIRWLFISNTWVGRLLSTRWMWHLQKLHSQGAQQPHLHTWTSTSIWWAAGWKPGGG